MFFAFMGMQYSLGNPSVIHGKGGPEENAYYGGLLHIFVLVPPLADFWVQFRAYSCFRTD